MPSPVSMAGGKRLPVLGTEERGCSLQPPPLPGRRSRGASHSGPVPQTGPLRMLLEADTGFRYCSRQTQNKQLHGTVKITSRKPQRLSIDYPSRNV